VVTLFLVDDYESEINPDLDEVMAVKWFSVDGEFDEAEINPPDYGLLMDTIRYVKQNYSKAAERESIPTAAVV